MKLRLSIAIVIIHLSIHTGIVRSGLTVTRVARAMRIDINNYTFIKKDIEK